ncbi:MAG: UDP-glucose 4-epimerase GalE [Rhodocyclaceae bacterium]|nr:UDP-glucose 4-epimerase GalE [Rhodocyclaceae bacterium]
MAVILVTGGAGYIGSHTSLALMAAGHDVVVVDNYSNSKPSALARVEEIAGRPLRGRFEGDVRDREGLTRLMRRQPVDAVIHFAALKAVGESVAQPLAYYENNIGGTVSLAAAMAECGLRRMVFSSSATVYGDPASVPIREDAPTSPTNPYGRSKWMMEYVLRDLSASDARWSVALLRYFNPVGAHPSGRIGEDPNGIPNNLMPFISQVAVGRRERLQVFGGDYPTADGTGIRDYIHVVDLAEGHVRAVEHLIDHEPGVLTLNLGTGRGYSVLEVVAAFERCCGRPVPYDVVDRRAGDVASCWADASRAQAVLGWQARRDIDEMCADAWRWQAANPDGFPDS